mgnify:FL=1
MIDMFDTIGTLVGTASRAGMTDKDGNMPNMKEALTSDAIGTVPAPAAAPPPSPPSWSPPPAWRPAAAPV